jgi:hypothetical protein
MQVENGKSLESIAIPYLMVGGCCSALGSNRHLYRYSGTFRVLNHRYCCIQGCGLCSHPWALAAVYQSWDPENRLERSLALFRDRRIEHPFF